VRVILGILTAPISSLASAVLYFELGGSARGDTPDRGTYPGAGTFPGEATYPSSASGPTPPAAA
jgi:hypothetical protein